MSSVAMLTCATCGNDEPEGSRFCGNCGTVFAAPDQSPADDPSPEASADLTCASCGNEEPEGSRFCGNCGAPFAADQQLARVEEPSPQPSVEQPTRVEPSPTPAPARRRRLRWVAAGTAIGLLLAAGVTAAVVTFAGGDGENGTEATPTEEQLLPSASSETQPQDTSPTLADGITPRLEEVAAAQVAVTARVRSLGADAESFAALRQAANSLVVSVARAQGSIDTVTPSDSSEGSLLSLLQAALASHLAYGNTISGFPTRPQLFTNAQARAAMAQAEQARRAYVNLVSSGPALPIVYISGSDHNSLLAIVSAPKPTRPTVAQRVIDLAPLLVGVRPDDPLREGRCFGPYPGASLRVSGVVYRSGFIQCGDDAAGDPSRASGIYRFSGLRFPAESRLVRVTGQAVIDEFSSPSQRGSSVTWTVFYDGAPICSRTVTWSGSRPSPTKLDCRVPPSTASRGLDLQRLRIQQVAFPASSGSFWAGLLAPTIVAEVPG